jgi:hypothetical protein
MKTLILSFILLCGYTNFSLAQSLQSLTKQPTLLKTPSSTTLKTKIPNGIVPTKVATRKLKPQRGNNGGGNPNVNINVGGANDTKIIREEIAISNATIRQDMAINKNEILEELYVTEANIRNDVSQGQAQITADLENTKAELEQAIRDNQQAIEQQIAALTANKKKATAAQRRLLEQARKEQAEMQALLALQNNELEKGLLANRIAILENKNLIHISVVLAIIIMTVLAMRYFTRND